MTLTADEVEVAVTGSVNRADADETLPTDATSALTGSFADLGYIDEDGITQTINADTTDIKAWQNGDIVRKIQTTHDLTYGFTMLQTNADTLETYYGEGSFTGDLDDGVVTVTGAQGVRGVWAINVIDGDKLIRIVLPDAQVTERGEINYVQGDAIKYPVTLTAFPDAEGVKAYIYLATETGS